MFRSVADQPIIQPMSQRIEIRNGNGNVRKWQRLTGTAKRQRKKGNGMVETGNIVTIIIIIIIIIIIM